MMMLTMAEPMKLPSVAIIAKTLATTVTSTEHQNWKAPQVRNASSQLSWLQLQIFLKGMVWKGFLMNGAYSPHVPQYSFTRATSQILTSKKIWSCSQGEKGRKAALDKEIE